MTCKEIKKKKINKKNLVVIDIIKLYYPLSLQKIMGNYYRIFHWLIAITGVLIVLFSSNISYLIIVLLILCLDGVTNILFQDCPISTLEKKYTGISVTELKLKIYSKLGINFKCKHSYENQLELIINVSCAIVLKIFVIIICDIFNIKISIK